MNPAIFKLSARSLVRRPLQTSLVLFALSTALGSTLTLMAVLAGVERQIARDLERIGADLINVHISPSLKNVMASPLRLRDCDWMKATTEGEVTPFLATMGIVQRDSKSEVVPTIVLSVPPTWSSQVPLEWSGGRFFTAEENEVCVLDEWLAKKLFPGEDPVGQTIQTTHGGPGSELRVTGVLKDPFGIRDRFEEMDVMASARSRMLGMMEFKSLYVPGTFEDPGSTIHGAIIRIPSPRDPNDSIEPLYEALGPERKDSVWIWSRRAWAAKVLQATDLATTIASVIWILVLLITGVMITTISLVAIRERYREIAIRRTEGGRKIQIAGQLLLENVILSVVAGGFAVGIAHVIGPFLQERYLSWTLAFRPEDLALLLGLGTLLGALATVLPAWRAASLDPVTVLKNE